MYRYYLELGEPERFRRARRARAPHAGVVVTISSAKVHSTPGARRPGWRAWAAPLAAAAAAAAVVAGGSAPGRALAADPAVTAPAVMRAVPDYYVALAADGNPNFVPSHAVVRSTASGRVLATIRPPAHGTFVAVTAAASDRTFVLGEQPWATGGAVQTFEPETFYLLTLGRSGTVKGTRRLPGVPVQPQGSMVTGLALSPGGHKLAVAFQPAHLTAEKMGIRIYSIPSGATRTWFAGGTIGMSEDDSGAISWTADGRTLAFDWIDTTEVAVRLLNTSARGGSLIADSRLAVVIRTLTPRPGPFPARQPLSCQTDQIISPDGSVIVCGASAIVSVIRVGHSVKITAEEAFLEYSAATGKLLRTMDKHTVQGSAAIGLYWSAPAGKVLIVATAAGSGSRAGVLRGARFTPLPGAANLGAAAW